MVRQFKLYLISRFLDIKPVNPKLRQDQIAKELGFSRSTSQRYRNDINMLSPYKIPINSHKRRQKILNTNLDDNSNGDHDLKLTSNDFKRPHKVEPIEKIKLKGGGNIDIIVEYLDDNIHNINL